MNPLVAKCCTKTNKTSPLGAKYVVLIIIIIIRIIIIIIIRIIIIIIISQDCV